MSRTDLNPANAQTLRLRDGRALVYTEYGQPAGKALFYFHGGADSRLEAQFLAEPARRLGVHLIGIDRPGMGRSHYQRGRRLLDWPDDVVELSDHLGFDRFAVVGISGGGPYALSCAYKTPERLTACGVVGGEWHTGISSLFSPSGSPGCWSPSWDTLCEMRSVFASRCCA